MRKALVVSLFGEEGEIIHERRLQLVLLGTTTVPLGTIILSPVLETLTTPFEVSNSEIGLLITFFVAPSVVLIPFLGLLSDRYGRKPILVTGLIIMGVAGVLISLAPSFRVVLGLRLVQGIGAAGIGPTLVTSIGDLYSDDLEPTAQGLRLTTTGAVNFVVPPVSGLLVGFSWKYPFLLYGVIIPIGIIMLLKFDEPLDSSSSDSSSDWRDQIRTLSELLSQQHILTMVLIRGLPTVIWVGYFTYISVIIVQFLGQSPGITGFVLAVTNFTVAAAASQSGRLASIFDSRFHLLVVLNGLLGAGFVSTLFGPTLTVVVIGGIAVGGCSGLLYSIYRSILTGLTSPTSRGALISLSESVGRLSATITPVIVGGYIATMESRLGTQLALQTIGTGLVIIASVGSLVGLYILKANFPTND
jgi:MFS family permease